MGEATQGRGNAGVTTQPASLRHHGSARSAASASKLVARLPNAAIALATCASATASSAACWASRAAKSASSLSARAAAAAKCCRRVSFSPCKVLIWLSRAVTSAEPSGRTSGAPWGRQSSGARHARPFSSDCPAPSRLGGDAQPDGELVIAEPLSVHFRPPARHPRMTRASDHGGL